MSLSGFDNWQPFSDVKVVDVPELQRPRHRPDELPGEGRHAAVMLLLYNRDQANDSDRSKMPAAVDWTARLNLGSLSGLHLVLTKRHENLNKHAGQISLPGGRQDPGESLEQTALRETGEEIGIAPNQIEVLGQLNSVYIPPSDFTVAPFVGWYHSQGSNIDRPKFVLSEAEVDQVIDASVAHMLKPGTLTSGPIEVDDGSILDVPFYQVDGHQVWGATAIILSEFLERVSRAVRPA